MPRGFMGKVLWIDLSQRTVREESLEESLYRQVLGGCGLGVRLLYDRMRPGVDPLGAENILGFVPGLLTGTGAPFSGRFTVVCKSPLTGGWGEANCGGYFGPELRRCGYDGLFVTGVAQKPTYLTLFKGKVDFYDAGDIWGSDALACEAELKRRHGEHWQVAAIGQAGENRALIAGIVHDRGRLAARAGVGAVMGAKRLKAIILKGHLPVVKADLAVFRQASRVVREKLHPVEPEPPGELQNLLLRAPERLGRAGALLMRWFRLPRPLSVWLMANQGTPALLALGNETGDLPVRNWRGAGRREFPWQRAALISGRAANRFNTGHYACSACPLHCGAAVKIEDPATPIEWGHRVGYQALAGLGANLLIDDLAAVQYGQHLCNRYGLDVISTAAVIGFAFEAYEKGLIHEEHTGGMPLRWGDPRAMLALIQMIARREQIGRYLADGVKRAAEKIGRGAEAFAIHVGGQELPFHDPRQSPACGAAYLLDPAPGRHTAGGGQITEGPWGYPPFTSEGLERVRRYDYGRMGPAHAQLAYQKQVQTALGLCEFQSRIGTFDYAEMIRGTIGWALTPAELLQTGERIQALRQAFNWREGIRPGQWHLPDRAVGLPPLEVGPTAGVTLEVAAMRRSCCGALGWDPETGRPLPERLEALGLQAVADQLWPDRERLEAAAAIEPPRS